MTATLSELLATRSHKEILNAFCQAMGVAGAIIDLEGNLLAGARWQRICTDFHRANDESCKRCIESDIHFAKHLQPNKQYSFYKCKNGLIDAASPIIVEGKHLANAFIGQFLTAPPDRKKFKRQAKEFGFNEEEYLAALDDVPIFEETRVPDMVNFIKTFATMVAESFIEQKRQQEKDMETQRQAKAILELSTPVIKVWEGIVAAPLIGVMNDERALQLMERFLGAIIKTRSPIALLDITGVPEVDTQSAQYVMDTVCAAKMLGAEVIMTGVSPGIAQTLVHLGINLKDIQTRNSFADGLRLALERLNQPLAMSTLAGGAS